MSPRRLTVIFCACLALFLVATLPLPVVLAGLRLESRGIGYARAEGTLWRGRVEALRWRGYTVGDAAVTVRPLMLLAGRLAADVAVDGAGLLRGSGRVQLTPFGTVMLSDLSVTADVARLPVILPLSGHVIVEVAQAEISRRGCRSAAGTIRTDALVRRPAGLPWAGPELAGTLGCMDGTLHIPLSGHTAEGTVAVGVAVAPKGTFDIDITARTADNAVVSALSAAGFVAADGAMTLTQKGRWMTALRTQP